MDIVRHDDGTLTVPVEPPRHDSETDDDGTPIDEAAADAEPTTITLHPGEGGYDEALAQWDQQQNPEPAVSTASGRDQAMTEVHQVAENPDESVVAAVEALDDPEGAGEALRHVLVGGEPSVDAFAHEIAEAEGGEPIPAHTATTIIGEVLAELD